MGFAEFIIGPAHRVRPPAGPMAGSGRTRWLHPGYPFFAAPRSGCQWQLTNWSFTIPTACMKA